MLGLLLITAPWAWSAELGAQFDSDTHGVLNAAIAKDDLRLELITDTLALHWRPNHATGRAFVSVRVQGFAAELFISPWTRGEPDPTRALMAIAGSVHAGWIENLGRGFYTGVRGSARGYFFRARGETSGEVPGFTPVFTPELLLGWWTPTARAELSAGIDVREGQVASRVRFDLTVDPEWTFAPYLQMSVGAGRLQDDLTKTRIGGLNPYVVPVAGAAWAEWWVEDFAAIRVGPKVRWSWGEAAAVIDAAYLDDETYLERFEDRWVLGFGLLARAWWNRFFLDVAVGYAPFIERQEGVLRVSVWALLGSELRAF